MTAILLDGTRILSVNFDETGAISIAGVVDFKIPKENIKMMVLDSIDEFDKVFKPIQNPETECCFHFETYGDEYNIVVANHKINPATVWTVVDGDYDKMYVQNGLWLCDRVMHIITEIPAYWPVQDFVYFESDNKSECA